MDLPGFSVMPAGLDDWDRIWRAASVHPDDRRAAAAATWSGCTSARRSTRCGRSRGSPSRLAAPPRATTSASRRGCSRSGCAAPAATTSARCPGSPTPTPTRTAPTSHSSATRTAPAARVGARAGSAESPAVPAQHLLACSNGHLDEFPYTLWVHQRRHVPEGRAARPQDARRATSARASARPSSAPRAAPARGMAEAKARVGTRQAAPKCRGRHPHLNAFDADVRRPAGADHDGRVEPVVRRPPSRSSSCRAPTPRRPKSLADRLRAELGVEQVRQFGDQIA